MTPNPTPSATAQAEHAADLTAAYMAGVERGKDIGRAAFAASSAAQVAVPDMVPREPTMNLWQAKLTHDGRVAIYSDDFAHDVMLIVFGEFRNEAERLTYATDLAKRMSADPASPMPLTEEQIMEMAGEPDTSCAFEEDADRREMIAFARAIEAAQRLAAATATKTAGSEDWRYCSLQAKVRDLLHLLSFADIKTPTEGDATEAVKVMANIRNFINTERLESIHEEFVMVPRKATDAMRYAWMEVYDEKGWSSFQSIWDAAIAAAPVTQVSKGERE